MADPKTASGPAKKDKVGLIKYLGQVRQEGRKVVWPTSREVVTTTILVLIMVLITGAFFFLVDWIVGMATQFALGFGGKN